MAAHMKHMTEGKPGKLIFAFALPLMMGNVFQQLYTVVDTMVVGKYLGVGALAALGAADWMNWMMLGIIQGFTQGFAILMAHEFGAGQYENLRRVIGNSCVLSALFSILLVMFGQLLARPVLILLQTPGDILPDSLLYLQIMFLGIPVVMAYNLLACILRSLGDGKTPLQAMVFASLTNIVLDLLFVMVFHWGIAGAAAATVIAQMASGLFCMYHISRIDMLHLQKGDLCLRVGLSWKLLGLGFPMAFQNCIIAVGGMIVQFVINGFGSLFIAAFTATNKLYGLLESTAISFGFATATYMGQNWGAGNLERIRMGMRSAMKLAAVFSVSISLLMLAFGKNLLLLFISSANEDAPRVLELAYQYLVIMSVTLMILYILHVYRSAIQGMGNTIVPMIAGIMECVGRISVALLLTRVMGEYGLFFAESAAWLGSAACVAPAYYFMVRGRALAGGKEERAVKTCTCPR